MLMVAHQTPSVRVAFYVAGKMQSISFFEPQKEQAEMPVSLTDFRPTAPSFDAPCAVVSD
ncbi:MAG: hypothetical protein ACI8Z5_000451 [Lentimonas sp.]|jgi:hypothetical protein